MRKLNRYCYSRGPWLLKDVESGIETQVFAGEKIHVQLDEGLPEYLLVTSNHDRVLSVIKTPEDVPIRDYLARKGAHAWELLIYWVDPVTGEETSTIQAFSNEKTAYGILHRLQDVYRYSLAKKILEDTLLL